MATHDSHAAPSISDNTTLGELGGKLLKIGAGVGVLSLGGAALLGMQAQDGGKRFFFAYLVAFVFFLTISLGSLFFVTVQHLTRAGWSVTVRRIAEVMAQNLLLMALLSLVIIVPMLMGNDALYAWVNHAKVETDHLLHAKAPYLNLPFFLVRCGIYFGFWVLLARFFIKRSTAQDTSGDATITSTMQKVSAPAMIGFALTLTFASFDFVMSLDPYWFSTIFGVYIFAGCAMSFFATFALTCMALQKSGRLATAISTEHYHDIGKLLFAFLFFWGYIAFSQFMLIWYSNVPEETEWYQHRMHGGWGWLGVVLILGHFFVPFLGLLSRHIKRRRVTLAFWAVFLLAMHYVDLYWLVVPTYSHVTVPFGLIDILALVGIGGLWLAGFALAGKGRALLPLRDPRLPEAMHFENI